MGNVKDGLYDTNNDDYLVSDVQSINDNDASTANYFKDEIKAIQKKTDFMETMQESGTGSLQEEPDEAIDDYSSITEQIINHRSYIKPTRSKTTMHSTRAAMESIAY